MAGNSGFAISVDLQDNASKGFDAINKRIAALLAPAERFNKAQGKFGEVSGINRAAEGMQTLGDRALGAARAVERLAGPMAGITSAASLGGLLALTKQWGEAGNAIGKTAYLLNMPVDKLSALHLGARLAGSSAEALDNTLSGLQETIHAAFYSRDPKARSLMNAMFGENSWRDAKGNMVKAEDLLGRLADKIATYTDNATKARAIKELGGDTDLMPFLSQGDKAMEAWVEKARKTGGVLTEEMAQHATEMNSSWRELGETIEGLGNRIADLASGPITSVLDYISEWIQRNEDLKVSIAGVEVSYTELGAGVAASIAALGMLKPAIWVLRGLGLLGLAETLGTATVLTSPLLLTGPAGGEPAGTQDQIAQWERERVAMDDSGVVGNWWRNTMPVWAGGDTQAHDHQPYEHSAPYQPGAILEQMGISAAQFGAFHAAIAAKEHARYDQAGGSGGMYDGRYQLGQNERAETAGRLDVAVPTREAFRADPAMQERFFEAYTSAHNDQLMRESAKYRAMSPGEQLKVLGYAHNQGVAGAERWLETGQAGRDGFNTPGTAFSDSVGAGLARLPPEPAPNASGHVQVDVTLRGAHPGTTAHVTATGAARASPPRVETSMPMAM